MTCNGTFIPKYKKSKETSANPYYGSTDKNLVSLGINTTDKFIVTEVMVEQGMICFDCRKERCAKGKR